MSDGARARSGLRGVAVALRFALPLLAALGGCAPRVIEAGPAIMTPQLDDDKLTMADGAELPLRVWRPAEGATKAVILALHGFNDYSNAFDWPAQSWAKSGIVTYAYDQRGFGGAPHPGRWAGERTLLEDLATAARLVRAAEPGKPIFLLGESMGGGLLLAGLGQDALPPHDGLILAAPAIWGRELQNPLATGLLWTLAHSMPWMELTGEGLEVQPSDNIEMLRALGRDPLIIKKTRVDAIYGLVGLMDRSLAALPKLRAPALLLYGAREDVMPSTAALEAIRRLEGGPARPRVAIYGEGYHMLLRDLQGETVHGDIVAWIFDLEAPLPSGADLRGAAIADGTLESLTQ